MNSAAHTTNTNRAARKALRALKEERAYMAANMATQAEAARTGDTETANNLPNHIRQSSEVIRGMVADLRAMGLTDTYIMTETNPG